MVQLLAYARSNDTQLTQLWQVVELTGAARGRNPLNCLQGSDCIRCICKKSALSIHAIEPQVADTRTVRRFALTVLHQAANKRAPNLSTIDTGPYYCFATAHKLGPGSVARIVVQSA